MSTGFLAFDFDYLLADGQGSGFAVFQRNYAVGDAYGGEVPPDWQLLSTVPCIQWWDKSTGIRSANREYVTVTRTVPVSEGALLIPAGTDVTQDDRVTQIVDGSGDVIVEGVFDITGVIEQRTHMELYVMRTSLGP